MSRLPAPWQEFKDIAEAMANAAVEALTLETGAAFELGNPANFDPDEMLATRPTPIRAYVVDVHRPLRDVLIILTSLGNELAEPLIAPAVRAALGALDITAEDDASLFTVRDVAQFDDIETAIDQADALYLEASYEISMPLGDLRMVLGTGLLESATCHVNGVRDPWVDGVPGADGLDLGDDVGAGDDGARYEFDDGAIGDGEHAGDLVINGTEATADELSALEAFDRELAAQEATSGAPIAGSMLDGVPASAGPTNGSFEQVAAPDTSRWASLLSGVEVELSAELGRTSLELGDITSLVADRVLTLDQMADEPVTVYVNGTPYATARLVIVDGEYGIEIIEVISQQQNPAAFLPQLAA